MSTASTGSARSGGFFRIALILFLALLLAVVVGESSRSNVVGPDRAGAAGNSTSPSPTAGVAGSLTGHSNLTLDESGLVADEERLTFATLEQWSFAPDRPVAVPDAVRRLDGREQRLSGFMFPLEPGAAIRYFCLLKTTQSCCYGPMPQYNQYVLVEMEQPVTFEATKPVTVTGRFHVDPQPEEGYIYRMEGSALSAASAEALKVIAQ